MTTSHFHRLMGGSAGTLIAVTGVIALLASLLLLLRGWLKGRVPADAGIEPAHMLYGMPLRATAQVTTASLVGVWHPQIWINPGYWGQLSDSELRQVAYHERVHLERRDNLHKLVLQFLAGIYAILPFAKRWVKQYELDSELAVDDRCRRELPADEYQAMVTNAAMYAHQQRPVPILSALSQADMVARLRTLGEPRMPARPLGALFLGCLLCLASTLPGFALLLHAVPRCLLACYLGY